MESLTLAHEENEIKTKQVSMGKLRSCNMKKFSGNGISDCVKNNNK